MADYRLSARAEADLSAIADYTLETFGIDQARRYRNDLEVFLGSLAENPPLGRQVDWLAPGLRRLDYRSHAVFYAKDGSGVLIVRILHARMDASRHLRPAPPRSRWEVREPPEPVYGKAESPSVGRAGAVRGPRARPGENGYLIFASL